MINFCCHDVLLSSYLVYLFECPGGGMVDAVDLKSIGRKAVGVQVPPWAPFSFLGKENFYRSSFFCF